jgi:hypothetical protein
METNMDNTIYNFAPEIFSIGVAAPKHRVTTKQILKKIRCKHLSLEKVLTDAGNYFLFTYDTHPDLDGEDRPEWAEWAQHSVAAHQLNHLSLDAWVAEGLEIVSAMESQQ